jgi:hypothetical protein
VFLFLKKLKHVLIFVERFSKFLFQKKIKFVSLKKLQCAFIPEEA